MRFFLDLEEHNGSYELDSWQPETTIADLVQATGGPSLPADEPLYCDNRPVTASSTLAEVKPMEGMRISRAPLSYPSLVQGWSVCLSGGSTVTLPRPIPSSRPLVAGRSPYADIVLPTASASWEHLHLQVVHDESTNTQKVRITDPGSTNGSFVDGQKIPEEGLTVSESTTIHVGDCVLTLQPAPQEKAAPRPGSAPNVSASGTAPFNRPPRQGALSAPEKVEAPTRKNVSDPPKFNIAMAVGPIIMAAAMVAIMQEIRYALFAMLSPILSIGMWVEQKRRHAKDKVKERVRFEQEMEKFKERIALSNREEIERLHDLAPAPDAVQLRALLPAMTLWRRRSTSPDLLTFHVGTGHIHWAPELTKPSNPEPEVQHILEHNTLWDAPLVADLREGGAIGIVGPREQSLALARSLVLQAATHTGPADMTIAVCADSARSQDWVWTSWLPHMHMAQNQQMRWFASGKEQSDQMLRSLYNDIESLPTRGLCVVVDSDTLTEGRESPARDLLAYGDEVRLMANKTAAAGARRVAGIVLASSVDRLPASCTSVVEIGEEASMTYSEPRRRYTVNDGVLAGVSAEDALHVARTLAHHEDPERLLLGGGLPQLVKLPELVGLPTPPGAEDIEAFWSQANGFSTEIGVGDSGAFTLDLVKDGPHGLVGGTTGSGKSEFLRSLVAGLAAHHDPSRLNFILVDFKGGAAFKTCERLPHTIGTLSNLDAQLAHRAIESLEAEMDRRQRLFAAAGEGVDNIKDYLATNPPEPMPRLLLVIDEFAMLAKDFPDVLSSLVSIGAVGRTLGVHMILATQRPAGVVNDDILANTNLRVALRVQSREDSSNVIGVPDASEISRSQMGRAYVKLGQNDISPVQTALVTGQSGTEVVTSLEVRATDSIGIPRSERARPKVSSSDANDLDLLIDAVVAAHAARGAVAPRKVWPEPLGSYVDLADFGVRGFPDPDLPTVGGVRDGVLMCALGDEPELQRQVPMGWNIEMSNLLLVGVAGSGTTTTIQSVVLGLAQHYSPEDIDIVLVDMGADGLLPLGSLPHVVSAVGTGQGARERQARFLRFVKSELDARRADASRRKPLFIVLDGFATLRDEFSDAVSMDLLANFYRVYADGPAVGIHCVVSTSRAKNIPSQILDASLQTWFFQLSDIHDYSSHGIRGTNVPAAVPGRCVDPKRLRQMQVATPAVGVEEAVSMVRERFPQAPAKRDVIGQLPTWVSWESMPAAEFSPSLWRIPVGIAEATLEACAFELYEGEHAMVAGNPRSGKSSLLVAFARLVSRARAAAEQAVSAALASGDAIAAENARMDAAEVPEVWAVFDQRSGLVNAPEGVFDRVFESKNASAQVQAALQDAAGPVLLLIDDGDRVDDPMNVFDAIVKGDFPDVHIIATGKPTDLRPLYSHWTKAIRKFRTGAVVQPNVDTDMDMFGSIPRRAPVQLSVGRGYAFLAGSPVLVQLMSPEDSQHRGGL